MQRKFTPWARSTFRGLPPETPVTCDTCGVEKTAADFYTRWRRCKDCRAAVIAEKMTDPSFRASFSAHVRQWRDGHPEHRRETGRRYKRQPEQRKKNAAYSRDYYWRNPEFEREQSRAWFRANPIKNRLYVASYRARRNGVVSERDARRLLNRFLGRCFYCGARATTFDHVIPLSRGGRHTIGNLLPACKPCNSSKNASTIVEWRYGRKT